MSRPIRPRDVDTEPVCGPEAVPNADKDGIVSAPVPIHPVRCDPTGVLCADGMRRVVTR
jgi:hypothetical protein